VDPPVVHHDGRVQAARFGAHDQNEFATAARRPLIREPLGHQFADVPPRIERPHRILEDHLHATAQLSQFPALDPMDLRTIEDDPPAGVRGKPQHRPPQRGLTAP